MKSDHLNSDLDLDPGNSGQQRQRQQDSTDQGVALGVIDLEHDAVYFGAESSPNSFSGPLGEGLQDHEVLEYIRRNNRSLYDRLWDAPQKQPSQLVTPAATEQVHVSDGARDALLSTHVANKLDSETAAASGVSEKSLGRSISNALLASPDSISDFLICGEDLLLAPCGTEFVQRPASSVPRGKKELQQDLLLLQQRRYIQSLLLSR
jgi:hypothetical protein